MNFGNGSQYQRVETFCCMGELFSRLFYNILSQNFMYPVETDAN